MAQHKGGGGSCCTKPRALTDTECCLPFCLLQAHELPLAKPFESTMTRFQKLLVLRCLRPDRVLAAIRDFVSENLGQRFIEPPPFDLPACFKESSSSTPLVFVLSPGVFDTLVASIAVAADFHTHRVCLNDCAVCLMWWRPAACRRC